jgi:uncharacterized membrane protein YbhN (UPF0104 family)
MFKKGITSNFRNILGISIVLVTIIFFVLYSKNHPQLLGILLTLDPSSLLLLTLGYSLITLINAFVLVYSLRFIGQRVPVLESFIITGYSSVINFFGPLQSGPGFRAAYLKQKYSVRIRDFFITTVIFYGFFALVNGLVIAIALVEQYKSLWWTYGICIIIPLVLLTGFIYYHGMTKIRVGVMKMRIKGRDFWFIGLGAVALSLVTAGTYYVELLHINSNISPAQALIYTAVANLALFVSLTPGAIGFRESFLVLSQHLHAINVTTIVGASIIDRAFYVCFLGILFLIILGFSGRKYTSRKRLKSGD